MDIILHLFNTYSTHMDTPLKICANLHAGNNTPFFKFGMLNAQ